MAVLPQHMQALERAQEKRLGVAQFRRDINALSFAEGARKVADAIQNDHDGYVTGSARVGHLLRAVRFLGPDKVRAVLGAAGVHNEDRKVRQLTVRQCDEIALRLRLSAQERDRRSRR